MEGEEPAPQEPDPMDHAEKAARGPRGFLGMAAPRMKDHKDLETVALGNAEEMVVRGFRRVGSKGEQVVEEVLQRVALDGMDGDETAAQGPRRVENKGVQVVEEVLELAARARMGCEVTAAQGIED